MIVFHRQGSSFSQSPIFPLAQPFASAVPSLHLPCIPSFPIHPPYYLNILPSLRYQTALVVTSLPSLRSCNDCLPHGRQFIFRIAHLSASTKICFCSTSSAYPMYKILSHSPLAYDLHMLSCLHSRNSLSHSQFTILVLTQQLSSTLRPVHFPNWPSLCLISIRN
ncbi:hypothetical protein O181_025647 [Austropuccinia psidii MF-1]|uniref:Uncharacterized protein n=1 Tax=Austropuccinia psidii MF-1 TaxID=1389203 RepID=A0A9Q3CLL5_9BASI|nr:hypothetical protein [Austropuccinia psidii MF-1]